MGEIIRQWQDETPELLPYGYLVGETQTIDILLKGAEQSSVDALAFDCLIPKSIIQR